MIGIDIASVERIEAALKSEGFVARVFTDSEREYCDSKAKPEESYAAIFCAKEAAAKAVKLGFSGGLAPRDIEVMHNSAGAPLLVFHGAAAIIFSRFEADVSLSHDGGVAVAAVELIPKDQ